MKDKLEVSVPELTTQHSVFTGASAGLTSFEAASSGAGGAPKLGSVQERMVPQSFGGGLSSFLSRNSHHQQRRLMCWLSS